MESIDEFDRPTVARSGKRVIKRGLELIVSTLGRPMWCFPNESLVVLMYHRILPEGHPDWKSMQPGMVISARTFELHLQVLKEHFTPIHLKEWLQRSRARKPLPPRACAITFDDGWSDNYETALPILRRHQVPATLFLVSDYVNTARRFWPERLVEIVRRARGEPEAWERSDFEWLKRLGLRALSGRDEIISVVKSQRDEVIHDHLAAMEAASGIAAADSAHVMSWPQARAMVADGLVEPGSHTRTHYRLGRSSNDELLEREIAGSKQVLESELDKRVELFCYPNGEISPWADRLVRRHYLAACSTERGWNGGDHDPHRIRRIGVHEDVSADYHAFLARLSGWI